MDPKWISLYFIHPAYLPPFRSSCLLSQYFVQYLEFPVLPIPTTWELSLLLPTIFRWALGCTVFLKYLWSPIFPLYGKRRKVKSIFAFWSAFLLRLISEEFLSRNGRDVGFSIGDDSLYFSPIYQVSPLQDFRKSYSQTSCFLIDPRPDVCSKFMEYTNHIVVWIYYDICSNEIRSRSTLKICPSDPPAYLWLFL